MNNTRVGIIAEGATDYRFLPPILKRIASERVGIDWPVQHDDLDDSYRIRKTGHGGVVTKVRALVKTLRSSPGRHAFYVILLDRKTCKSREHVRRDISASDGSFAIGIAIEEIEAWVLADRKALTSWLGISRGNLPGHQYWSSGYSPEKDKTPKKTLDELTDCSNNVDSRYGDGNTNLAEAYAEIWEKCVDLKALEISCPKGFKPFCKKITNNFRVMKSTGKK